MIIDDDTIGAFVKNRDLVRIERSSIDTRSMQAIPLGFSKTLLAALYIFDFHVDGLLFLRRDTISDMHVNATAAFQRQLMQDAMDLREDFFCLPYSIESYARLLAGLPNKEIVILESESLENSDFWIGRYVWNEDGTHWMHEFTGAGNWHPDLTEIKLDAITCCQLDSNYITYYQRYFDEHGFPGMPG